MVNYFWAGFCGKLFFENKTVLREQDSKQVLETAGG